VAISDITDWLTGEVNVDVSEADIQYLVSRDPAGTFSILDDSIRATLGSDIKSDCGKSSSGPLAATNALFQPPSDYHQPITRAADSLEVSSCLTLELQTKISKRIYCLLRHAAHEQGVKISQKGYVSISDLIKWLYKDLHVILDQEDIKELVSKDLKGRYQLLDDEICAVNGHSIELPELFIPEYNENLRTTRRYLIHETYSKSLPAIFEKGLSRMGHNNVHLSMQTGHAGLQRKHKPNIGIYVDVKRCKTMCLKFFHCVNDVIMCPGDLDGFISPYFFHKIRNIQTGALIEFTKPSLPVIQMKSPSVGESLEVMMSPPGGATGIIDVDRAQGTVLLVNEDA